jgi:hypothetical protein
MLSRVYIQRLDGEIASDPCYTAWRGFKRKGAPIAFFQWPELKAGKVPLARDTLVVGGMVEISHALKSLSVQPPAPLNLPESLAAFRGRRIWTSTFGELHRRFKAGAGESVFVKPLVASKAFTGYVIACLDDFEPTIHLPAHLQLQCSEVVEFASEWRYFVHRHQVVGVGFYAGDVFRHPEPSVVREAIAAFQPEAPVAYGIDFGVTTDGRTLLVEVNDAFALGCYGLGSVEYADMLEDRWQQVVSDPERSAEPIAAADQEA